MTYQSEVLANSPLWYARLGDAPAVLPTTATASSAHSVGPATNAIDGSIASAWITNGVVAGWLRIQFPSAVALTRYKLRVDDSVPGRAPRNWTFEGSNDGTTFTVLDTQTAIGSWVGSLKTFTFANSTAYLYYRINVTANNGDGSFTQISEFITATVADSSGNGRDMVPLGGVTLGAPGLLTGDSDTAASFTGTGRLRFIEYASWMSPTALTVAAIIKTSAGGVMAIIDRDETSNRAFQFRLNAGKLEFVTINGGAGVVTASDTTTNLADNVRHHIAATYDASNIRLYVDGALVKTQAAVGALSTQAAKLAVGANFSAGDGGAAFFTGTIDEPAFWGTALSGTQIAALAAAVAAGGSTTGAVAGTLPALTGAVTGTVTAVTTGTVAGVLPALTGAATGHPVTVGASQGTLPALTGSAAGTVAGPTTGAVQGTLPPLTGTVAGDVVAPITGTVAGVLPALTGGVSDAPVGQLAAHSTTRITSAIAAPRDVDYLAAHSTTRITSSIVPSFELAIDPVTGRPQYRLIVVDSHGTPLGELQNAAIGDPVQKLGQPGTFTATLPSRDPKATLLDVGAQVQVWAGAQMLPGAWFVLVQPGKDGGGQISYEFVGLEGLLDNVVIGTERPELLRNGGFEEDLRFWHPTWLEGSAAQAPPKTTIVGGSRAKEGGKALQVEAVESVNVREVKTAAIFYGNRPSASEPLAAGFLPGGEKLITDQLPAFSKGTTLLVEGFTADVDSGDGQALSARRANAAKAVIQKARPDLKVTAVGRGETIQVAPNNSEANSAKNRRILLTGSATRVGHRQIVQQFFTWTNTSRVPIELELDGWIDLIDYVGPSKDRYGFYINRRNGASLEPDALPTVDEDRELLEAYAVSYAGMTLVKAQAYDTKEELYAAIVAATPTKAKIVQAEHTDLPDDFPHQRWTPDGTSELSAPPDGRKYLYEVRLYGSAGKTIFDEVSVKPNLRTGFYNTTRPELFAGLVAEAQNTAHGKVDLNLETNCKPWGVRDDFEYEWKTPRTVWDAIEEQLRADDAPDFGIVTTQTRRIATTWARRGRRSPVHLRLGDIVTGYTAGVDGDKVATTAIATSNRSRGPGVAEARVRTAPVNGLVFERVQAAEPDRSRTRLRQMATAMTRYGRTDVLTSVTCDPKWTVKLLGQVGLGDRVWCVVHDGDTHVEGWYRIVEIRHSISKHQLSYELTPEV